MSQSDLTIQFKDIIPNECPWCGYAGIQTVLTVTDPFIGNFKKHQNTFLVIVTRCEHCLQPATFVSHYIMGQPTGRGEVLRPLMTNKTQFSEYINDLSPRFVESFNQSEIVESLNLDELQGMGYRKALEMLVTDYVKKELNVSEEEAEKTFLSGLINKLPDSELKNAALASAWVGNDETHYYRVNADFDFRDMKEWINAFVNYLEMKNSLNKATKLVDSKRKK